MLWEDRNSFLALVRLGIGNYTNPFEREINNWNVIKSLAEKQGLSAIVLDGADKIPHVSVSMPAKMKLEWIGEVLHNYEARYIQYEEAIGSLAQFYNSHEFKMMVLKGYACSLDWPNPKHRPCGDIDIWQFGKYREADNILVKEKNIAIDSSHHHHTVFYWHNFMIENHYDFINVHHHKSNVAFEFILKEQAMDASHYVDVSVASNGVKTKVYLPSSNLHALFLLKHACIEFAASGLNLRQLLDWAFFVKAHRKEVDWDWLLGVLDQFGMKTMFDTFNAICVDDLGFSSSIFPYVQFEPRLKERVLNDIISPLFPNEKPSQLIARVIWKFRRWKANEWKHNLCYKESMLSAFLSGVWTHLIKPSSI
jgi:hypothetical protein